MVGHWEGNARIIVIWCHQTNLSVKVDLHEDGTVTGTVGDATLTGGQFLRNRGWLGRRLNLFSDYIITGSLNGAIVKAEGITRSKVMIPLDFVSGALKGGLDTSGTMFHSKETIKEKMPFSAAFLTLTHSPIAFATDETRKACDDYRMDLVVDPTQSRCDGSMVLRYQNQTSNSLAALRLHLDPNMSPRHSLEILSVEDNTGAALAWNYQPLKFGNQRSDKGEMDVRLSKPLAPFGATTVSMKFRCSGHNIDSGMVVLQDDPYQSLDGWYPKAMTARGDGWSLDDDRPADYDVTVQLPSEFCVASTGRVLNETSREKDRVLHLQAERVRGFTVYAFPHWQRRERRVGQVELGICLPTEATTWADRMLDSAADAIAFYEKEYAPFPCRHLDIVCLGSLDDPPQGSSAACNVITIFLGRRLEKEYRQLIAHEAAHQYWGVAIGLPRQSIGWVPVGLGLMMDEHYAVARGLDATLGRKIMREFYFRAEKMGFDTTLSQSLERPLQSPPPWSFGWNLSLMHGKGYAVCSLLRDLLGAEKFQGVIRKLIKEYSGGVIHDGDLIAACKSALGQRLDWFAADWVNGRATLDYAISAVNKSNDGWDVVVTRVGTAGFPVMVEVVTESGERFRQRANRTQAVDNLHFKTTGAIKSARVDPDDVYPDLDKANNAWPRVKK